MTDVKNGCDKYFGIANLGIEIKDGLVYLYEDGNMKIGGIELAVLEIALQKEKTKYIEKVYEIK